MVDTYDAIVEASYNTCAEQGYTHGAVYFAEDDIRISEAPTCCGIFKYNPNCVDEITVTKRAYGICAEGDKIYYSTDVKCNFNAGSSIRKINKDGTNDQCVKDTNFWVLGLTYTDKIYCVYGEKLYREPTPPSTEWVEKFNLETITGQSNFRGVSSLPNGDFLCYHRSTRRIYLVTKEGVNTIIWQNCPCGSSTSDIAYGSGNTCWMSCYSPKKLYKLTLPNLPVEEEVRKKWALGRVGVRYVRL